MLELDELDEAPLPFGAAGGPARCASNHDGTAELLLAFHAYNQRSTSLLIGLAGLSSPRGERDRSRC